jgi:hypothetical protein
MALPHQELCAAYLAFRPRGACGAHEGNARFWWFPQLLCREQEELIKCNRQYCIISVPYETYTPHAEIQTVLLHTAGYALLIKSVWIGAYAVYLVRIRRYDTIVRVPLSADVVNTVTMSRLLYSDELSTNHDPSHAFELKSKNDLIVMQQNAVRNYISGVHA